MNHNHRTITRRGRRGIALSVGLTAGGMLAAALSQLAVAPSARADITDIYDAILGSTSAGSSDFTTAASDFSSDNVSGGLAASYAGLDDYLFAPEYDLLYNGYAALLGESGGYTYWDFTGVIGDPTTASQASTEASTLLTEAQSTATDAVTAFEGGSSTDILTGLSDLNSASVEFISASEVGLLGLADSFGL